jgi:DnaJ-class molecular chaperone
MSKRTLQLEGEARRALLAAIQAPDTEQATGADNAVWKITASVIAKVQENLLSETTQVRSLAHARTDETTVGAVRRLVSERNGIAKKYTRAKDAWEDERLKFSMLLDAVRQAVVHTHDLRVPSCVEMATALRAYDLARGAICPMCDGAGSFEDDGGKDERVECNGCDGTGIVDEAK